MSYVFAVCKQTRCARPARAAPLFPVRDKWSHCERHEMMRSSSPAGSLVIRALPLGPFATNAWILAPPAGPVTVVDPGMEPEPLLTALEELGRPVDRVLLTHGHLDHVAGCAALRARYGCPIHLHPEDFFLYHSLVDHGAWYGFQLEEAPRDVKALRHGEAFPLGDGEVVALATPGHSPGSVCFFLASEEGSHLVCGDTLFAGAYGRTDLPGGSFRRLKDSVTREIFTLDGATRLLPGHGPATTVARERSGNPLVTTDEGDEA